MLYVYFTSSQELYFEGRGMENDVDKSGKIGRFGKRGQILHR